MDERDGPAGWTGEKREAPRDGGMNERDVEATLREWDDELPPELRAVAERYAAQPVPRPTAQDTARLLARLLAEEPAVALAAPGQRSRVAPALRVARWRVYLLGPQFWIASVLLLIIGAAITQSAHMSSDVAPFIMLAPLTAILGLCYALRTPSQGLRAVETSAPVNRAQVAAGLALAIVAFDCAFGGTVTVALALAGLAPFLALLSAWLAPLLLLTGLSLPIALRWGAVPAALVGGGPWLLLAGAVIIEPHGAVSVAFGLPLDTLSILLHFAAALVGLLFLLSMLMRRAFGPAREVYS